MHLDSMHRDLSATRNALAIAQLEVKYLRLVLSLSRFNPRQPRVPAGNADGGQWSGEGGRGGVDVEPVSSRPRSVPVRTRIIRGRIHEVTPGQEARLDVSAAQARALVREVQQRDPTWRPRPSIYEGVEGGILANQSDALQASARLRLLGVRDPILRSPESDLLPRGQPIGVRYERASGGTRTVSPSEFNELLEKLSIGADLIPSPTTYRGHWYRRRDGFIFGVRASEEHGITFDVIEYNHPIVRSGYKVHQK